jgi:hypothetical protein
LFVRQGLIDAADLTGADLRAAAKALAVIGPGFDVLTWGMGYPCPDVLPYL